MSSTTSTSVAVGNESLSAIPLSGGTSFVLFVFDIGKKYSSYSLEI